MAAASDTKRSPRSHSGRKNRDLARLFRSLADENRLQILRLLMRRGRLHVSALCRELRESQPAVSHHLTQLRHAGLIDFDREGKFNLYFIRDESLRDLLERFFGSSPHGNTASSANGSAANGTVHGSGPHRSTAAGSANGSVNRPTNRSAHRTVPRKPR